MVIDGYMFELQSDTSRSINANVKLTHPSSYSLAVDIIFEPYAEGQFNYNLIVDVKRKPSPLQLNVKGEGYKMQVACSIQDDKGSQLTLLPGNTNNIVNFGEVTMIWGIYRYSFTVVTCYIDAVFKVVGEMKIAIFRWQPFNSHF
jgi:hypothetical protein